MKELRDLKDLTMHDVQPMSSTLRVSSFGFQAFGVRVSGFGFRATVGGSGFGIWVSGFGFRPPSRPPCFGLGASRLGFTVQGLGFMLCFRV